MTREEFLRKARENGLLEQGIRLGIISSTQVMYDEVLRFYRALRSQGETYVNAAHDTANHFRISYPYVTRIIGGSL